MTIAESTSMNGISLESIGYEWIGQQGDWFLNNSIVFTLPNYPCDIIHNGDELRGKIAVSLVGGCSSGKQAETVMKYGAVGLIVISTVRNNFPSGFLDISVPTGSLRNFPMTDLILTTYGTQFMKLLTTKAKVFVTLSPDPNPLKDNVSWVSFVIFFGIFSMINICIALYKLILFIRHLPMPFWQPCLAKVILTIEIFSNIMRILYVVEPAGCGFGLFPLSVHSVLFTFSWPYSYISTILLAFYWKEICAASDNETAKQFITLPHMWKPAIVVSIGLLLFEHILATLRATYVTNISFTIYIQSILYLAVAAAVGGYFMVMGMRLLCLLRNTFGIQNILMQTALLLGISGFGNLIHCIGNVLTMVFITNGSIRWLATGFGLLLLGLDIASLTHVLSFNSSIPMMSQSKTETFELVGHQDEGPSDSSFKAPLVSESGDVHSKSSNTVVQ